MKNSKATVSNLTEQDIKELQNYLAAMNDLYEQEPEELSSEFWDDFFKDMQDKTEMPLKYCDRVRVVKATLTHDYINGKYQRLDKPRTVDTYVDIVHEKWQNKLIATSQKYNDVINKAIIYAEQQHLSAPPKIRDIVKACIRDYNKASQLLLTGYSYFPNGKGIVAALQTDTSKGNKGVLSPVKNDLIYKTHDLTLTIQDFYKHLTHYSGTTRMVFSTILRCWQQQKTPTIHIDYYKYAELRGINQATAKKQLLDQLELLKFVWFSFDDVEIKKTKNGKTFQEPVKREFASVQSIDKKRGSADIELGNKFYKYLSELDKLGQLTQKPDSYYKLSPRDDEFAILMCDYFTGLERTQAGQPNYHKHAVATILEHCEFKKVEQLIANGERHIERFIMQPFDRALQRLIEIGYLTDYTFMEKDGKKADYSRLMIDYEYFITLNACIETTSDNSHLIECKSKRASKARKSK